MGGIRYFLFLSALLLNAVVSEASSDEVFCSIDDEAELTDQNNAFTRGIITPYGKKLPAIDLMIEFDWQSIMPLNIRLGSGVNDKVPSTAVQSVINRVGDIFMEVRHNWISRQLGKEHLDAKKLKYGFRFNTQIILDYIFQDTFQRADESKRLESYCVRPTLNPAYWVESILNADDWEEGTLNNLCDEFEESPGLGDFSLVAIKEAYKYHPVKLLLAYLDQGIYLLIYDKGFQFLDFDGIDKLFGNFVKDGKTWRHFRMVKKKPVSELVTAQNSLADSEQAPLQPELASWTYGQYFYNLFGYLPSGRSVSKWLSDSVYGAALVSLAVIYAVHKKFYSSSDADRQATAQRRQSVPESPEVERDEFPEKAGGRRMSGCEDVCKGSGEVPKCQVDLNQGQRQCSLDAEQLVRDEGLRAAVLANFEVDQDDRQIMSELGQKQHQFVTGRVFRSLHEYLNNEWTIEEIIRILVSENRNKKLFRKLQWLFKEGTPDVPSELISLRNAVQKAK
ncbi:hypothetical protein GZ77_01250 [Endozoicomonas montiporae]|uniref:YARHG domain-containing protein n=2 Tax=Endozoicomonas montiporae TaxID=1027273 RepID=A0A081NA41_9GAMM|nr:hypothetical protein GZ77_01250 [Endozoicomonas montiporae]